ncbi:MAG: DUF1499 domain-containing protein [Pseudomonadota bacterium]|nr:DUF1499 domain-containing protein [Pseudomonadota bacterium]
MIDFATLKPGWRPNQFLMAPEGLCQAASPHATSPDFAVPPTELMQAFHTLALAEPRVTVRDDKRTDLAATYVQRSKFFRFPDIVDVRVFPRGEAGSTLAIYSRAVYGIRDFGVNERRVRDWVGKLADALPD